MSYFALSKKFFLSPLYAKPGHSQGFQSFTAIHKFLSSAEVPALALFLAELPSELPLPPSVLKGKYDIQKIHFPSDDLSSYRLLPDPGVRISDSPGRCRFQGEEDFRPGDRRRAGPERTCLGWRDATAAIDPFGMLPALQRKRRALAAECHSKLRTMSNRLPCERWFVRWCRSITMP